MGYREIEVKDPAARTKSMCDTEKVRSYTVSVLPSFRKWRMKRRQYIRSGSWSL